MSFNILSIIAAVAALLLGTGWLFFGSSMIIRWGAQPNDIALVIGRRIGSVYLGMSLLFFLLRGITTPEIIFIVSTVTVVIMITLAGLGIFEYAKRRVGPAILASVVVEIFLGLGFGRLAFFESVG